MSEIKSIQLKAKKSEGIRRQHPWVFSGAIKNIEEGISDGALVQVRSNKGGHLGYGHYSKGTSIAIRMISFDDTLPDADFFETKIKQAISVRRDLDLIESEGQNICRLIHAEGDGLSGLIVDYYDRVAVIQTHSLGMHHALEWIVNGLQKGLEDKLVGVYNKSAKVLRKNGHSTSTDAWVFGSEPEQWKAKEHGNAFKIDLIDGQKTGFFIDQRENRFLLSQLSKGKKILNTFSYTGGFSVSALQGGAASVHSLDSSARALEIGEANVAANGFGSDVHHSIQADAMEYLKSGVADFDIVILDPPAFAKSVSARHAAIQGYKRINLRALETMKPGSLLFTFSCSQAVDDRMFTNTVISAAIQAGRTARILYRLHQPADHPVSAFHPEGAYLKGLVVRVE
jgi:23S rRNA (cytosine1962-C5)-methyltransferase